MPSPPASISSSGCNGPFPAIKNSAPGLSFLKIAKARKLVATPFFGINRHAWTTRHFFFQAEDGIRDVAVTGVQTCALPIYSVDQHSAPRLLGHEVLDLVHDPL